LELSGVNKSHKKFLFRLTAMETILLISDDSEAEDSSTARRRAAEEQDPLEGRRNLRKKKPKVNFKKFSLKNIDFNK
jgi:hypothetical protein